MQLMNLLARRAMEKTYKERKDCDEVKVDLAPVVVYKFPCSLLSQSLAGSVQLSCIRFIALLLDGLENRFVPVSLRVRAPVSIQLAEPIQYQTHVSLFQTCLVLECGYG